MAAAAIKTIPLPRPLGPDAAPAVAVALRLQEAAHQAVRVGGAVRDLLLDLPTGDFDVATSAPPDVVANLFPQTAAVGLAFGVLVVIQDEVPVETATFRTEGEYRDARRPDQVAFSGSLAEDAQRRDFTVNALYLDPAAGQILDPCGGLDDCRERLLRTVGEPAARFQEDGLRLLRVARLAAQCGLTVVPETRAALSENKEIIRRVAAERIGKEVSSLLTGPDPAAGLELLADTGLLEIILPEVAALRDVPQPPVYHPEGDVWTHTLQMLREASSLSLSLALGIQLHDVGKPATITYQDRIRFHGHAKLGAEKTREIGRRLRLRNDVVAQAAELVAQHMRFLDVRRMRPATLKRFLRQERFAEFLELHRLDCLASHGNLDNYHFCLAALEDLAEAELRPAPLLRGQDLLDLGFREGPQVGAILRELETAQLEGLVRTRQEAEAWLHRRFPPGQ